MQYIYKNTTKALSVITVKQTIGVL